MRMGLSEERGSASFFALCFLGASILMALGLLHIARQGEAAIGYHEMEVQLRLDAEGAMEKAIAGIASKSFELDAELPVGEEVLLQEEENERGINIRTVAKRAEGGIFLIVIAATSKDSALAFKSVQCFLEKKEEGYVWRCWLP